MAGVPVPPMAVSQVVDVFTWEVEGLEALRATDAVGTGDPDC